MNIFNLVTLQNLRGNRSQATLLIIGVVKALEGSGILQITPEQLTALEQTLYWLLGYFLIEKVDDIKKGTQK